MLADALLRGRNVLRQSAADPDCAIPPSAQDWDILLIDDLQLMQEEAGQQALCELIRSSPERHFVLLSRGVPPGCLTAFQYTGLMTVLETDDLLFDADDVRRLFQLSGANAEIAQIMDVKLPTVKTHVSHILEKLDVKRRAEAKTAAKKLHLVPEEL